MSRGVYDKVNKLLIQTAGSGGSGGSGTVDSVLSASSTNPVQNKVITAELNKKVNASGLATVATTGSYNDLADKPSSLVTVDDELSLSSTNPVQNRVIITELNKKVNESELATVATSGDYNDLENLPDLDDLGGDFQYDVMPVASVDWKDAVLQYVGSSNDTYIKGEFYECVETVTVVEGSNESTYSYAWEPYKSIIQVPVMPAASEKWYGRIVQFVGNSPYTNGYFYKCILNNELYEWVEWSVMRITGDTPMLVDVSGASVEREFRFVTIRWTDPENSVINGQTLAQWGGTKLVRKVGSAPQSEEDGEVLVNSTTKNQYATDGFIDDTVEYDKIYYYRFFPYSTINVVTKGTALSVNCKRVQVPLPSQTGTIYYDKYTHEPTLTSEVGIEKSGQTSGKSAGNYEMTLSLISDDYQWADGSFTDKTITWTIQKSQGTLTPNSSFITLGNHSNVKTISFSDLYDRTITNVSSSNTDVCTATTDGETVTISYVNTYGEATVTVTTNSTDNCLQATATISVETMFQVIYGFQIDGDESDPSSMVNYLVDSDNYNYTPAHMDYSTGTFDYGSWQEDEFFMPKPCMVRYDGTVAYYLDPDDYTKKINGEASDVGDTTFQGNAMMEWGRDGYKIWYKVVPFNSAKSGKIYIANYQADANYHDWSFHNCDGVSADHFYTPIYNGSLVDGKLRSMSGQNILNKRSGTDEISYAKANNPSTQEMWNIECFADRQLINFLLILMGKSTNTQAVFGQGACNNGSESVNNTFTSGVHNTKGLFYGTNSGNVGSYNFDNCVKIFGMENYWGFIWRRTNGLMYVENNQKVKFTYGQEDGSGVSGYNTNGDSYIDLGIGIGGTSGGYISRMKFTDKGMFPEQVSGSDSTYYADRGEWFSNGTQFSLFGGRSGAGGGVGAFCVVLDSPVSAAGWSIGAALSLKPLT